MSIVLAYLSADDRRHETVERRVGISFLRFAPTEQSKVVVKYRVCADPHCELMLRKS